MSEGGRPRGRQSVADMVRSLALVLGVVGLVVFATVSLGRNPVLDIDYSATLESARLGAPYEVLAPEGVVGLRATSVGFTTEGETTVWHLGMVTESGEYVAIDQTDGDPEEFVAQMTEGAQPDGSEATLAGETWARYVDGGSRPDEDLRGLVREEADATVVVSGTAPWTELEEFAGSLQAE